MADAAQAPILIKKKKNVTGDGHHGGAWKVAYADFVTAMMAFFLMMWLLNATSEEQKKGLADYFSPEIPLSQTSGGGMAMLAGEAMVTDGRSGGAANQAQSAASAAEEDMFRTLEAQFDANSGESTVADDLLQHIDTRVTDEGLVVDLFDLPGEPLYRDDTAIATPLLRDLVAVVDDVFRQADNMVAVTGHVRSDPVVLRNRTVWPISSARAEDVRTRLAEGWTGDARLARIEAHGDMEPLHPDRMDLRNNRLEIILLRKFPVH